MKKPFIHLNITTDYSLGKSNISISKLVEKCVEQNMPAIAITDENNLFGCLEFAFECAKNGIQPIIGIKINVFYPKELLHKTNHNEKKINQNQEHKETQQISPVILLAKSKEGYLNLLKLVSTLYIDRKINQNIAVELNELLNLAKGLILIIGPLSQFGLLLNDNENEKANNLLKLFKNTFGDDLFIELIRHSDDREAKFENSAIKLAYENEIPVVATNPVTHLSQSSKDSCDAMLCIANNEYIMQESRIKADKDEYFKSAEEMYELFSDIPDALYNAQAIAKKCSFMPEEMKPILPKFTDGDEFAILKEFATQGLERRFITHKISQEKQIEYKERLVFELEMINKMGFPGYFLIVSDFIKWSKKQGIPVGPGRGSGAGSIVAWALEITDIDPLRFGLLFERFLNPDRISLPDFDVDFCQARRDEVIKYVCDKYGSNKVAQIITFGKLQARAVLRDVGRVLQMPYNLVDKICKMVPNNPAHPITLQEAIDIDKELQKLRDSEADIAKLFSISLELEGIHRHASTHAAGIVIADRDIVELAPLYKDESSDMCAVQFTMKYIEAAGLMKFDFLGLKTLTVIADTCDLVKQNHGIEIIPNELDFEDKETYKMLASGKTVGVFQFEGFGMREAIKSLVPDRIEDLIALGSLYRPGPMSSIPDYVNRKHGRAEIEIIHEKISEILNETYGIIIYQEQIMEIAKKLANYTLGEADILRRAIGKKNKAEMMAQKEVFIQKSIANGVTEKDARDIFDLIEKFASYGFNKSHATAYAAISYQTAYLKRHYTIEFLTASLNLDINDQDKIHIFCNEAKIFNINILPPSINQSGVFFEIHGKDIRFGLAAIKGSGVKLLESIIQERKNNGNFKTLEDFLKRTAKLGINKRILEALIKSGALNELEENKGKLIHNIEKLIRYANKFKTKEEAKQISLFETEEYDDNILALDETEQPWSFVQNTQAEYEALGFYLAQHPLKPYEKKLKKKYVVQAIDVESIAEKDSIKLNVAGVIISKKVRSSKHGKFAFLQLSDESGILDISVFNENILHEKAEILNVGQLVFCVISAKKDGSNGLRVIVEDVAKIDDATQTIRSRYTVTLQNQEDVRNFINFYKNIKENYANKEFKNNENSIALSDIVIKLSTPTEDEIIFNFKGTQKNDKVSYSELINFTHKYNITITEE